jgi:hypothetical protein
MYLCIYTDPKELKRIRDREYYARHADDIQKRRRQARENKQASTPDQNTAAIPVDIDAEENETQTPLSVPLGNDDQLLPLPYVCT